MVRLTLLLLLIAGYVQGQVSAQPLLSHVSVARSYFKGKWYLFYHGALASGKTHLRNVKVTELKLTRMETFNPFTAYK